MYIYLQTLVLLNAPLETFSYVYSEIRLTTFKNTDEFYDILFNLWLDIALSPSKKSYVIHSVGITKDGQYLTKAFSACFAFSVYFDVTKCMQM